MSISVKPHGGTNRSRALAALTNWSYSDSMKLFIVYLLMTSVAQITQCRIIRLVSNQFERTWKGEAVV
jgi:hypothetical protein